MCIRDSIKNGAYSLSSALNEDLSTGAAQLDAGVTQMAGQLKDGTSQLASGTGAILSGAKDLDVYKRQQLLSKSQRLIISMKRR